MIAVADATVPLTRYARRATPVLAWCERCGGGFPLFAIVREGTGACPHCRQPLAPDPDAALVDWAAVVDSAYDDLITVVRRLEQPPSHLRVNTDQLLQSLAEEITSMRGVIVRAER